MWEYDNRQNGWYFKDCRLAKFFNINYDVIPRVCYYNIGIAVYDQFLVIDGRRIDFLKYQPEYHFDFSTENTSGGVIHTYECNFEFMGRNFYVAVKNTITSL